MYEEFFGLRRKPFDLVPNPEFLFLSPTHNKAAVYLDYAIRENVGFILLTGEVGSGKTTIIRELLKKLGPDIQVAKVFHTRFDSEQLLAAINDDFGLPIEGKGKVQLLKDLYEFLIGQFAGRRRAVLIIDEAQNLSTETLEELRMLSNLETDQTKLLQIILVGQPELKKILSVPELRQLRQRISIHCHIQPLKRAETEKYVLHRLEIAGNRQAATFGAASFDLIHQFSGGIPRLINIICDFCMLSAYADGSREITGELVAEVAADPQFEGQFRPAQPAEPGPERPRPSEMQAPRPAVPPPEPKPEPEPEDEGCGDISTPLALRGHHAPAGKHLHLQEIENLRSRLDGFETAIRKVCSGVRVAPGLPIAPPPLEFTRVRKPDGSGKINSLLKWLWS